MSGIKLPAIDRPNGTVYRPRKIQSVPLGNEDELTGIVVFGTHDVRYAKLIAEAEAKDLVSELYDSSITLEVSGSGKQVWLRRDLCGFEDDQPLYNFTDDPTKGRAGVKFSAEEVEVTP